MYLLLTSILQYGHFLDTVDVDQSGALVNLANNHSNTGLHEAVRGGHIQLVELLLHRGALVHMRNKRQRTALDCAHETAGKNTEIQKLLQKACADAPDIYPIKPPSRGTEGIVVQRVKHHESPNNGRKDADHTKQRSQKRTERAASTIEVLDQTAEAQSDRRRLARGETVDSSWPQSPHAHCRSLTRCHTISQDLTQRSLQKLNAEEQDTQSRESDVETAVTEMDYVVL